MRRVQSALAAAVVGLVPAVVAADDLTGTQRFLCASSQATLCWADGQCEVGTPSTWDMPQFIEVDLAQKRVGTTKASGENRSTPIAAQRREDGKIVLQGYENGRAFSFLIDEKTGSVTVAVAREDLVVTVFGACTPKAAPD